MMLKILFCEEIAEKLKSQPASAILRIIFVKLLLQCCKVQFFPWSSVDFSLYHLNSFVSNGTYICSFCNILPDKLVGVLDSSFLP